MKKMIFLLLMAVAFACFMPAWDTAHPPGVLTFEAAMYGDNTEGRVVNLYTVLAQETRSRVDDAMKAREQEVIIATSASAAEIDKYLRCVNYIIIWGEQYLAGQLSREEYASLVAGAISLLKYIKPISAVSIAGYYLRC